MNQQQSLDVRRLSDLDDWEFYEVIVGGDEGNLYTIGLRPYPEFGAVEFELWDGNDEDPWDTGNLQCPEVSAHSTGSTLKEVFRIASQSLSKGNLRGRAMGRGPDHA